MKFKLLNFFLTRFSSGYSKCTYQPVIGLEIHAQIKADSKLFSSSGTEFGIPPNSQVSFFDSSLPGTLPVLNKKCVIEVIKTALALHSKINMHSTFDRKHYFYADLPAGYQITQQRNPIAKGGYMIYWMKCGNKMEGGNLKWTEKKIDLIQIQLEQDSGKSLHNEETGVSLIDLNRAGVGLMEIITEPQFSSSSEVVSFVKELQLILKMIDSCEAKMEEGGMRVDASVSIRKIDDQIGVRTEIKNLNSLRSLSKAIDFEIQRQIKELNSGRKILNETLSFNPETGETLVMRDKEKLHDYRYMPEPNLPPLILNFNNNVLSNDVELSEDVNLININCIAGKLPSLPHQIRERLVSEFHISLDQAFILVSIPPVLRSFIKCVTDKPINKKLAANFFINQVLSVLNENDLTIEESSLTEFDIGDILYLLERKKISLATGKEVLKLLIKDPGSKVDVIISENNWFNISDDELLKKICIRVIEMNPEAVNCLKAGQKKPLNFLIGNVQKELKIKADGQQIANIILQLIK